MKQAIAIAILCCLLGASIAAHLEVYARHKAELSAIEIRQEEQAEARHLVLVERFKAARAEGDIYRAEAELVMRELAIARGSHKTTKQLTTDAFESLSDVGLDSLRAILLQPAQ